MSVQYQAIFTSVLLQLILMYCEIEAHEKVVEQLLAGLANKNPKVTLP